MFAIDVVPHVYCANARQCAPMRAILNIGALQRGRCANAPHRGVGVWGEERGALFTLFGALLLVITNISITILFFVFVRHWRTSYHKNLTHFAVFGAENVPIYQALGLHFGQQIHQVR